MQPPLFSRIAAAALLLMSAAALRADEAPFQFGFSKVDITPAEPLRLSGYANRDKPFDGIDEPLFVRGMALRHGSEGPLHVLLSVDTIGFPGVLTREILARVAERHSLTASRFVVCCTHSHTAPHIARGLSNLFNTPPTPEEEAKLDAYADLVRDRCVQAVNEAVGALQPGKLQWSLGKAGFARNRRVLKDGIWTGFGENPDGPVDHSLPVLCITDLQGERIRGILFNYACHCTTFGGDYNRLNGDWAGYAAKMIEAAHPQAVALCTIGCGADANPERDSRRAFQIAQAQGTEIAEEVARLLGAGNLPVIESAVQSAQGYAGLPIDRPDLNSLREAAKNSQPQIRRHAEIMLDIHRRMGRLPETYPMPVQVWRFGNEFAMVFLGGEVCVDYAFRIKRELAAATDGLAEDRVWVTAYANDVFAYVAPERMRSEGGYEVDRSMIYYLQPGRWSSGTEDVILQRVHELFRGENLDDPRSPEESLKSIRVAPGYRVELLAAEPLIRDPVNFALDERGRLWVVEMGDYPRGNPAVDPEGVAKIDPESGRKHPWDGPSGGTIKVLTDTDGDGRFDKAQVFLEGLSFPTGVYPWRDGVLICGAPDITFARDLDGDGRCDRQVSLFSGFEEANPQHRVGGFEFGLDGRLYLSSGTNNGVISCIKTGQSVNISGRDSRIDPDRGLIEPVSGQSQYGRSRDEFNHWFGNNNSEPLWEYVIEDRELKRNPFVVSPRPRHHLTDPAVAPPVYPTSRTVDRFNDLFALNRFTSACSPHLSGDDALVCEPVHNLISRIVLSRGEVPLQGGRHPQETNSEFLASSDNWFRPVRILSAPDGSLWICDMYRHVIEHPEWIPEAWQKKLDLYAGHDRGRIYRVFPETLTSGPLPDFSKLDPRELIGELASPHRWRRDTAQRLLMHHRDTFPKELGPELRSLADDESRRSPEVRVQALWTMVALSPEQFRWKDFVGDPDPRVVANAVQAIGLHGADEQTLAALGEHPSPLVRYRVALAAGDAPQAQRQVLPRLAGRDLSNPWMRAAILSSAPGAAEAILVSVLRETDESADRGQLVNGLIATALGKESAAGLQRILGTIESAGDDLPAWKLDALRVCLTTAPKNSLSRAWEHPFVKSAFASALTTVVDENRTIEERVASLRLLEFSRQDKGDLLGRLTPLLEIRQDVRLQTAAVSVIAALGGIPELLSALPKAGPTVQGEIQTTLLTRKDWTRALLDALAEGSLSDDLIGPAARQSLLTHSDAEVKQLASRVFQADQDPDTESLLTRYLSADIKTSDGTRGKALFEKNCAVCHQHGGLGKAVGPALANLQNKSYEFIATSVLDPNRAVESKYRSYSVATTDGRTFAGMIVLESATSIQLVQSNGQSVDILRRDIEEIGGAGRSFMPEGFAKLLTPQDLRDLAEFVLNPGL